jgi:hypothetical protein
LDKIVDVVVTLVDDVTTVDSILVLDGISSVLVIIDDCSTNIFIYFLMSHKVKIDKPSGSCVDV